MSVRMLNVSKITEVFHAACRPLIWECRMQRPQEKAACLDMNHFKPVSQIFEHAGTAGLP